MASWSPLNSIPETGTFGLPALSQRTPHSQVCTVCFVKGFLLFLYFHFLWLFITAAANSHSQSWSELNWEFRWERERQLVCYSALTYLKCFASVRIWNKKKKAVPCCVCYCIPQCCWICFLCFCFSDKWGSIHCWFIKGEQESVWVCMCVSSSAWFHQWELDLTKFSSLWIWSHKDFTAAKTSPLITSFVHNPFNVFTLLY